MGLDATKYPMADPKVWLVGTKGGSMDKYNDLNMLDPVFAGRLSALAQYMNKKIDVSSGYRSYENQVEVFTKHGGRQDEKGNWVGGDGYAQKPGLSRHNYGFAVDVSSPWLRALEKDLASADQTTLAKFGLRKPLTMGNGSAVYEEWHIVPIENTKPYETEATYRLAALSYPKVSSPSFSSADFANLAKNYDEMFSQLVERPNLEEEKNLLIEDQQGEIAELSSTILETPIKKKSLPESLKSQNEGGRVRQMMRERRHGRQANKIRKDILS